MQRRQSQEEHRVFEETEWDQLEFKFSEQDVRVTEFDAVETYKGHIMMDKYWRT